MTRQLSRTRTAARPVDPETPEDEDLNEPVQELPQGAESVSADENEETHTSTRRPASKRPASRSEPSGRRPGRSGWEGVKHNKDRRQTGDEFKVKENTDYLIHFLQPEPMEGGSYLEHFVKELANNQERASFVCIEDDCPLCNIGDKPGDRALFNIAVIDEQGHAKVMWWKTTPASLDLIEDYAFSERNSPLDRDDLFFEVSKKKAKNSFFAYKIEPIKARDLADEGMEPPTAEALEELRKQMFDSDTVLKTSTRRELRDIADDLQD